MPHQPVGSRLPGKQRRQSGSREGCRPFHHGRGTHSYYHRGNSACSVRTTEDSRRSPARENPQAGNRQCATDRHVSRQRIDQLFSENHRTSLRRKGSQHSHPRVSNYRGWHECRFEATHPCATIEIKARTFFTLILREEIPGFLSPRDFFLRCFRKLVYKMFASVNGLCISRRSDSERLFVVERCLLKK